MMKEKVFKIIYWLSAIAIVVGLVFLVATSILVRDTEYMVRFPLRFATETLSIAVVTALAAFILGWSRDVSVKNQWIMFGGMIAKVLVLNVLLQLSGFYTIAFPTP
jgi:hypothetical protein